MTVESLCPPVWTRRRWRGPVSGGLPMIAFLAGVKVLIARGVADSLPTQTAKTPDFCLKVLDEKRTID